MNPYSRPTTTRREILLLALAAFAVGFLRAWSTPAVSDAAFHLVRTGSALLGGSLAPYATSPGGEGSPVLGALVTALGAALTGGGESGGAAAWLGLTRLAASLLLGGAAAGLAAALAARADRAVAVLGVAFLVLPPAFGSSFALRPDAAAGGVLLTVAFARRSAPWAWAATLTTPVAIPAAVALSLPRGARGRAVVAATLVAAVVVALSLALPPGRRSEILAGLLGDWGLPPDGLPSTLAALRRAWAGGALAVATVVLARRSPLLPAWLAMLAGAVLFSEPGAFRGATAALVPPTCLLLVGGIARVADPAGPSAGPARPVLLAMLVPVALLILGTREDRTHREAERERTARLAQLDAVLAERLDEGAIASTDTGTLAALSARTVLALRSVEAAEPRIVVFRDGIFPTTPAERRLVDGPAFLAGWAPLELRRGLTRRFPDAVWVRRDRPHPGPVPVDYARALRAAWRAHRGDDLAAATAAWEEAVRREPEGLGLARQLLGVVREKGGDVTASEEAFRGATADPATVRARGHLADRALSAFRIEDADTLIAQAIEFNPHLGEVWSLRSRLLLHAGRFEEAMEASGRAVILNPWNAKILANHGSFLWGNGERDEARKMWERALREDARILGFLGDFRGAPDDSPAPPLAPIWSEVGFGVAPE